MKLLHGFCAVSQHGDMHLSVGIVPGNCEAKVSRALPVLRYLIAGVRCVQQVLCMFFSNIFDTKIVNREGKGDRSPVMFPIARGSCTLLVTFCDQLCFKQLLCNDAGLWQSVHTFLDADIDIIV